jgi:ATP-dependent DNA helicase RecQ
VLLFSYQDRYTQEFFIDQIGKESAVTDLARIERIKTNAREKLDLLIRYAQSHRCRRQLILDYFGDDSEVGDCQCDVCAPNRPLAAAVIGPAEIRPEAVTLVRQLLSGVARCRGKFGVGTVAEVLAGGQDQRLTRWGLNQLSVYGILRARPAKQIIAMLHRLLDSGLVRQRDPDGVRFRPVVELTPLGIDVMKGSPPPPNLDELLPRAFSTPAAAAAKEADDFDLGTDPDAAKRYAKLRAVRLQLARDRQLPAYCVCHDSTLKLIASRKPADADALELVKGMGPMKVKLYGPAILEALHS